MATRDPMACAGAARPIGHAGPLPVPVSALVPADFRAALLAVPPDQRDAWVDRVLGLGDLPPDGPELPRGCVPYVPCPVDAILRMADRAEIGPADVFVDIGSGAGRALALVHLLTGAEAIGLEIQASHVHAARDLASRLGIPRVTTFEGDATRRIRDVPSGSVFFLYCPFSGTRLETVLAGIEAVAQSRPVRVCTLDLPPLSCPWLVCEAHPSCDLAVYWTP
jgi:SAM-dependent methyltransferase